MRGLIRRAAAVAGAAVAALGIVVGLAPALPASATPVTGSDANGTYLALGDSVAFGFVPANAVPPPNYQDAHSFVGYPEDVAQALRLRVSNASCPGETTASMLVPGAQSNGCENSPGSPVGYRTQFPLHVQYQGTQMEYALKYLAVHRHTRLVTINIGANDAFLCQETTADHCTSTGELQALVREIEANLATIYTLIRGVAHYHGLLVALTYYSLSYSDPTQVAGAELLDSAIASVTMHFGGKVADGFAAFEGPSDAAGGSPCAAGLLIKLPDGTCNIHPSPAGHLLLAQAIEDVV
jgi:lysophospholipase L1-like esterase